MLLQFMMLHIFDCLLYTFTKKGWDMWKVIKPDDKDELERDQEGGMFALSRLHKAWALYFGWFLIKFIIMSYLFASIINQKWCQPFVGVTIYQDYFYTILVPVWVVLQSRFVSSSHKKTCITLLKLEEMDKKNHFFRIRSNILSDDLEILKIEFTKPDETRTAIDEAIRNRAETLNDKLTALT